MNNYLLIFAIALIIIAVYPFITIWSLNTLFGLAIPYTLETWGATVWLGIVTFGRTATKKSSN